MEDRKIVASGKNAQYISDPFALYSVSTLHSFLHEDQLHSQYTQYTIYTVHMHILRIL